LQGFQSPLSFALRRELCSGHRIVVRSTRSTSAWFRIHRHVSRCGPLELRIPRLSRTSLNRRLRRRTEPSQGAHDPTIREVVASRQPRRRHPVVLFRPRCPPIVIAMLDVGEMSRMGSVRCRTSFMPAGHHVSALSRLDREPVKAVSPAWGRSEAQSLDRVEASRTIRIVMAGCRVRSRVR
jgi:hypothetical protein